MYGYIVTNKPELKIKEYDLYLAYYCGLCHSIKDQFGNIARLSLSYDLTFLTVLLTSLYECKNTVSRKKCFLKLGQDKTVFQNEVTSYVADMSILLSYLKCEDDWKDEKKLKAGFYKCLLSGDMKKVKQKYPDKISRITSYLDELHTEESNLNTNLEMMSQFFGKVFGEIFCYKEDMWKDTLYNVGYFLGEFVYVLDAYDDLQDDLEKKLYNPFIKIYQEENFKAHVQDILATLIAESCNYFEMLPIIENINLLRNILYSGVWAKFNNKEENNGSL